MSDVPVGLLGGSRSLVELSFGLLGGSSRLLVVSFRLIGHRWYQQASRGVCLIVRGSQHAS